PEDVVVGANLAAVLGNLAYKTQAVQILNTDKLGTSATGGTLDDKEVGLTITTPGVNPATAYEMKAYVEDDVDFYVDLTRNTSTTFDPQTAYFQTNLGPKVITKDSTTLLSPAAGLPSDGKITYPKGSTNTKEEQKVYAFAYVTYDTNDKAVQAQNVKTGYEVLFTDPIPLCFDTAKTYAACTSDSDMLKKGNVELTFLGDKWTVFDYTVTGGNTTSNGTVTSVTLGKQITRKESFNIDEQVTTQEGYVITLKDLSAFSPQRAQFDITDKDGVLVKRLYLGETDSATITEANNIVVKVNKVFPGAFAKQGIADVSLYSSQLVISNGVEITGGDSHKNWYGKIQSALVGSTEGIQKIMLYNDLDQTYKTPLSQTLNPGESIDVIKGMPGYKLNYLGLETVDYDSLTFSIKTGYRMTHSSGTLTANTLIITSGKSNAFQFGSSTVNSIYVPLESSDANFGNVFFIDSTTSQYSNTSTGTGTVTYYYATDESSVLKFTQMNASYPSNNNTVVLISIPELTEDNNGTSASAAANYHLNLLYDNANDQFVNTQGSTTIDKIGYEAAANIVGTTGASAYNIASKEKSYTTRRGNIFNGVSSTSASINYAKKIAKARFTLTSGASGGSATGSDAAITLKEGDPYTIGGGYSLMVDSITATIAGGDAGDITGIDELAPSVSEAAVVTALNTASNPLVVLDSQASDTANLIVVGGQIVNTVANAAGVNLKTGDQPEVMVYGTTKLVVAGYSAADTSEAGNALINWLNENRDSVRG
ncbi:MAG: hypothetical protein ABIG96_03285, partial [Candidatus Micrarchaeota archaeon]